MVKHDYGDYIPETDTILLNRSYPNVKEFIISVLHEIKHALDGKRLTPKKFKKKYDQGNDRIIMVKTHMMITNGRSWKSGKREYKKKWRFLNSFKIEVILIYMKTRSKKQAKGYRIQFEIFFSKHLHN